MNLRVPSAIVPLDVSQHPKGIEDFYNFPTPMSSFHKIMNNQNLLTERKCEDIDFWTGHARRGKHRRTLPIPPPVYPVDTEGPCAGQCGIWTF
jgi:hypothetical protein